MSNRKTRWTSRFGTLKNAVVHCDRNGEAFTTAVIETPKFSQRVIAFGDAGYELSVAGEGTRIWSRGILSRDTDRTGAAGSSFQAIHLSIFNPA